MCPSWCRSCAANTVAAPAISPTTCVCSGIRAIPWRPSGGTSGPTATGCVRRSEEHTSELQSRSDLVCRLLLEKKKKTDRHTYSYKRQKTTHPLSTNQVKSRILRTQTTTRSSPDDSITIESYHTGTTRIHEHDT